MTNRIKKAGRVIGVAVGALIVAAIIIGILNALVADGKWTLGWSDYSYDDSQYQVGDGSIPCEKLTSVSVDWIDGTVSLISCQDSYVSITESAETELPESSLVRWYVDENGALSIKYRNSSFFLGASKNKNKDLVVRIPERFLEDLTITVNGVSTNFIFSNLQVERVDAYTKLGGIAVLSDCTVTHFTASAQDESIRVSGRVEYLKLNTRKGTVVLEHLAENSEISTESGDVSIKLADNDSFTLDFETEEGRYVSDLSLEDRNGYLVFGDGEKELTVVSKSGTLYLKKQTD